MQTVKVKKGDTFPPLTATLTIGFSPMSLTNATVKFIMSTLQGVEKINSQADILNASQGLVSYSWSPSDTDTVGTYKAEFQVTFPDGRISTVPNDDYIPIMIIKDLSD